MPCSTIGFLDAQFRVDTSYETCCFIRVEIFPVVLRNDGAPQAALSGPVRAGEHPNTWIRRRLSHDSCERQRWLRGLERSAALRTPPSFASVPQGSACAREGHQTRRSVHRAGESLPARAPGTP